MEKRIISLFGVDELANALQAQIIHRREITCQGACTDSRKVSETDLFLALIGERFDAHQFLGDVMNRGCRAVVVSKSVDLPDDCVVFLVDNVERAFGRLARAVIEKRRSLGNFITYGLTGSYGKTTSKELLACLLAAKGHHVLKTEGNFNNFIGLPMTALRLTTAHDVAVFEMGANAPKEIEYLASIAQPEYGLITGVGPVHLQGFGSIEGVADGKGELIRSPRMKVMALPQSIKKYYEGKLPEDIQITWVGDGADTYYDNIVPSTKGCDFDYCTKGTRCHIHLPLLGGHNASNLSLGIALTSHEGWDEDQLNAAVAHVVLPSGRLERWEGNNHVVFLHDAYNANPASMKEALALMTQIVPEKQRCLILGDMLELGTTSDAQHQMVGELVAKSGIKAVLCVGSSAEQFRIGALNAGMDGDRICCTSTDQLETGLNWISQKWSAEDVCLIKGSHGIHLERVLDAFEAKKG